MSDSAAPYHLPQPIEQLCKQLLVEAAKQPVRVKCKSHGEAKRLRAKVYKFRNKLLAKPSLAPRLAIISPAAQMKVVGKTLIVSYPQGTNEEAEASEESSSGNGNGNSAGATGADT